MSVDPSEDFSQGRLSLVRPAAAGSDHFLDFQVRLPAAGWLALDESFDIDSARIGLFRTHEDPSVVVELTTWTYSSNLAVNLPRFKSCHGQSQSIIYGYRSDGSLGTRDWSRTDGTHRLRTTWFYSDAGKLTATHYGSTAVQSFAPGHPLYTPSVTYTYDASGLDRFARNPLCEADENASSEGIEGREGESLTRALPTTHLFDRFDCFARNPPARSRRNCLFRRNRRT